MNGVLGREEPASGGDQETLEGSCQQREIRLAAEKYLSEYREEGDQPKEKNYLVGKQK